MEIRLAKTAGFCFGVDRAVKLTYGLLDEGRKVATLGPLIHNPQTVEDLERRGALVADTPADVPAGYEVVIRSHGVPRSIYDELDARGCTYHDATCPFVKKVHLAARRLADGGQVKGAAAVLAYQRALLIGKVGVGRAGAHLAGIVGQAGRAVRTQQGDDLHGRFALLHIRKQRFCG